MRATLVEPVAESEEEETCDRDTGSDTSLGSSGKTRRSIGVGLEVDSLSIDVSVDAVGSVGEFEGGGVNDLNVGALVEGSVVDSGLVDELEGSEVSYSKSGGGEVGIEAIVTTGDEVGDEVVGDDGRELVVVGGVCEGETESETCENEHMLLVVLTYRQPWQC